LQRKNSHSKANKKGVRKKNGALDLGLHATRCFLSALHACVLVSYQLKARCDCFQGLQLKKYIDNTLGQGDLREAVRLPTGEDLNEWLAVHSKKKNPRPSCSEIQNPVLFCFSR
jgi:hypothetical protein